MIPFYAVFIEKVDTNMKHKLHCITMFFNWILWQPFQTNKLQILTLKFQDS